MRILVSDHSQVGFYDYELDTAKVFYSPPVFNEKIEKETYIGTDFKGYKATFLEYQDRISSAKSIDILEVNTDLDHIHLLISCKPQHYIPNIIKAMKGVSARLLMKKYGNELRDKLYKGHLWNPSYFIATVSENTENQIKEYIQK